MPRISITRIPVREQECPACGETFRMNDGGRHLKNCLAYQDRAAALVADWEDENGVWWTYDHDESQWRRRTRSPQEA
ncbi:MAG: hypothetical protein OXF79_22025 [Chloroflexi bacterium]|nr:hypothetical protein [Chloroflexota bacterium]